MPPPHNRTRFEVGAARKSHKIVPCAVFSFTTSVLTPHLFPKFCAVLIKYFTSHTIPIFSLYSCLYFLQEGSHRYHISNKTDDIAQEPPPFCVSVKLDYFFHTTLRFSLYHYIRSVLANKYPPIYGVISMLLPWFTAKLLCRV